MPIGFDINSVIMDWQNSGVFDYILPFLLIFAVVFGILNGTKAFGGHRGVHTLIAIVIGLFAIQVPLVYNFFSEIFPQLGVALAIMIVVWILVVIFSEGTDHEKGVKIGMYVLGAIIALIVVFNSFSNVYFFSGGWWGEWASLVIGAILLIGIIVAIALTGNKNNKP